MDLAAIPTFASDTTFHVVVKSPRGSAVKLGLAPWPRANASQPCDADRGTAGRADRLQHWINGTGFAVRGAAADAGHRGSHFSVIESITGHQSRRMLEHYSHIRLKAKKVALDRLDQSSKPPSLKAKK